MRQGFIQWRLAQSARWRKAYMAEAIGALINQQYVAHRRLFTQKVV